MKTKIFILTRNINSQARKCIQSFIDWHSFNNYHFVIGDTGSSVEEMTAFENWLVSEDFCLSGHLTIEKNLTYNFAKNNNELIQKHVEAGCCESIVLCNDDIIFTENVVDSMVAELKANSNIGTVGCLLTFPDGKIQHAGQFVKLDATGKLGLGHVGYGQRPERLLEQTKNSESKFINVIGNTAALMAVNESLYRRLGELNTDYKNCLEDLELNVKLFCMDYHNICYVGGKATHSESSTRKPMGMDGCNKDDFDKFIKFMSTYYKTFKYRFDKVFGKR